MNSNDEPGLKISLYEWTEREFSHDTAYWEDRAKNGSGLIQQIAIFVMKNGQATGAKQ